jgi:dTDP-4-dehydrorhamnose reductase
MQFVAESMKYGKSGKPSIMTATIRQSWFAFRNKMFNKKNKSLKIIQVKNYNRIIKRPYQN